MRYNLSLDVEDLAASYPTVKQLLTNKYPGGAFDDFADLTLPELVAEASKNPADIKSYKRVVRAKGLLRDLRYGLKTHVHHQARGVEKILREIYNTGVSIIKTEVD